MMDIGVANPSAQGQAMIKTATALTNPYTQLGCGPTNPQTSSVRTAMANTMLTK